MSKRVNLGSSGETPKKVTSFSIHAEPTTVPRASPGSVHKYSDYGLSPSASPSRTTVSPDRSELPKPALRAQSKYEHPNPNASPIPDRCTMPPRPPSKSDMLQSPATIATKENTRLNAIDRSSNYKPQPQVDGRPKTSRGKSCPSPDEFFDYVIPSPQKHSTFDADPAGTALMNDYQTLFASMGMAPPHASAFGAGGRAGAGTPDRAPVPASGGTRSEVQKLVIEEEEDSDTEEESDSESGGEDGDGDGDELYGAGQGGGDDDDSSARVEVDSEVDTDDSRFGGSGTGRRTTPEKRRERETELLACWLFACALRA
jgi:hypothetical protein